MYGELFNNEDRTAIHEGQSSQRILSENHDAVGMAGEWAFGELSGLWPDTEERPGGDGGKDFALPLRFTVDIKTARKPYNLIHEQGKPFADIFILAQYDEETGKANPIGWQWGAALKKAPTKDFGYGVINHYIPADKLKPIEELQSRIIKLV